MKLRNVVTIGTLLWSCATVGRAEETPASVSLQFSGIKYAQTSKTSKVSGSEATTKTNTVATSDLVDAYLWVTIGKFNFYAYPFQDASALFSASYMVRDDIEWGFDIGYNTIKEDEPKSDKTRNIYGTFATYYVNAGPFSLENSLTLDLTKTSTLTTSETGMETKDSMKGNFFKLAVVALYPLSKNAWYFGGINYSIQNDKDDNGQTDTYNQFGVTLAGLRVTL